MVRVISLVRQNVAIKQLNGIKVIKHGLNREVRMATYQP
jgi:hypothetical protein